MKTHVITLTETTSRFDKEQNDTDEWWNWYTIERFKDMKFVDGGFKTYQEYIDYHEKRRLQYQQKLDSKPKSMWNRVDKNITFASLLEKNYYNCIAP